MTTHHDILHHILTVFSIMILTLGVKGDARAGKSDLNLSHVSTRNPAVNYSSTQEVNSSSHPVPSKQGVNSPSNPEINSNHNMEATHVQKIEVTGGKIPEFMQATNLKVNIGPSLHHPLEINPGPSLHQHLEINPGPSLHQHLEINQGPSLHHPLEVNPEPCLHHPLEVNPRPSLHHPLESDLDESGRAKYVYPKQTVLN